MNIPVVTRSQRQQNMKFAAIENGTVGLVFEKIHTFCLTIPHCAKSSLAGDDPVLFFFRVNHGTRKHQAVGRTRDMLENATLLQTSELFLLGCKPLVSIGT